MVGVAGKSKGCKTCRRRKTACGLQRPQCVQCTRSKRVCLGYDRDILFVPVQASPVDKKTVMKSMFTELKRNSSASQSGPVSTAAMKPETTRKIDTGMARYSEGGPTFSPDNLSKASTRHQLINAFITTCVPDSELRMGRSGPWLVLLPQFLMRTKALETASLAISAAALGRVHNDTTLINESLKLYTQGLRELQNALWNPKLMYDDETLAACLSLSLYEVMECPGDAYNAYVSHCNGCMKLVEVRGIDRHTSGIAHQLFVAFRSQAILLGLETKRPNFLSSPLWVQGPWKGSPKRVLDRLIDCLAMGPIIFQQTERFRTLRSKPLLDLALDFVDHCWALDKALRGIYEDLERETAGSLYWTTLSEGQNVAYDPAFGNVFPVAFQF
ncbi:hypothetical protein V1507DRAFT_212584 [Lipomyces tetrasporus]